MHQPKMPLHCHPERSEGSVALGSELLRGVYTERSECAQHDSAEMLECGLATLPLLVDDLLTEELPVRDGFLAVPTGPGLGVELDWQALDRYCAESVNYP